MTITASSDGYYQIFGYLQFGAGSIAQMKPNVFYVKDFISADVAGITPGSYTNFVWSCQWFLNLYAPNLLPPVSKFTGSYPRLNFGVVDFAYRGQGVSGSFWNYRSQRFPAYTCWLLPGELHFPTEYLPPEPIANAHLYALNGFQQETFGNYADELSLSLISASVDDLDMFIYYQLRPQSYDLPASFGDI